MSTYFEISPIGQSLDSNSDKESSMTGRYSQSPGATTRVQ